MCSFAFQAIHNYRETERAKWNHRNTEIINRVRSKCFPPEVPQLRYVHILDLEKSGVIKPHIDSVRVRLLVWKHLSKDEV